MAIDEFEQLVKEAVEADFAGWDFSWLAERWRQESPAWDYPSIVGGLIRGSERLLDLGTGGGEFLSSLAPLPPITVATESYPPNLVVAAQHLAVLQVAVVGVEGAPDNDEWSGEGGRLPFKEGSFDLVHTRHTSYSPTEVARILSRGGHFITQQLGGNSGAELEFRQLLGRPNRPARWGVAEATEQVAAAGLKVVTSGEDFPLSTFADVGAVTYYLRVAPWTVDRFDVERDRAALERIHAHIRTRGELTFPDHYYWLEAEKP